jgi:hypothetical protein
MTIRFHIRETGASAPTWTDAEVDEAGLFYLPALELGQFITYGQILPEGQQP